MRHRTTNTIHEVTRYVRFRYFEIMYQVHAAQHQHHHIHETARERKLVIFICSTSKLFCFVVPPELNTRYRYIKRHIKYEYHSV